MTPPAAFRHRLLVTLSALFVIAAATRTVVVWVWGFDGLYGQDAFAYFQQASAISNQLSHGLWAPPAFHWPNGFPLLAGLTMLIFGPTASSVQLLNIILGAAVVVLIFLTGRDLVLPTGNEITNEERTRAELVGVVGAVTTALAGQLVLSSVVVMADTAALFWLSLSGWLVVRFMRLPSAWGLPIVAAAAGATAVITRWASALAAPAFAVITIIRLRNEERRIMPLLAAPAAGMAIALPAVFSCVGADGSGFAGYFEGWNLVNFISRTFEVNQGLVSYRFPNWFFFAAPFWHPSLMPPTMGLLAVPGLLSLRRRRQSGALVYLGLWLLVPYLFFVGLPAQNLRFCLTMWVPAVILTAVGAVELIQSPGWRKLVLGLILISALGSGYWNIIRWSRFFGAQNETTRLARHLDETLPSGALVLSFEATLTLEHYTDCDVRELYRMTPEQLQRETGHLETAWIVVNPESIATQWQNETPGTNMRWLRDNRVLSPIKNHGPWVVYQVAGRGQP